jgi:hypothetical protein
MDTGFDRGQLETANDANLLTQPINVKSEKSSRQNTGGSEQRKDSLLEETMQMHNLDNAS